MAGPFGGFLCQPLTYRRVSMWPQVFEVDNRFLRVFMRRFFLVSGIRRQGNCGVCSCRKTF